MANHTTALLRSATGGISPLYLAVVSGDLETVRLLLSACSAAIRAPPAPGKNKRPRETGMAVIEGLHLVRPMRVADACSRQAW